MSVIEENGTKMAAVLCVASCFPVVATVYAMETEPDWHGDKYISDDATAVKGWQEIDNKSYYFNEEGQVNENVTAATVTTDITADVQEVIRESSNEIIEEEQLVEENIYLESDYVEPEYTESDYVEPAYDESAYVEPMYEESVYMEPTYGEVNYEEPMYTEPTYDDPGLEYID